MNNETASNVIKFPQYDTDSHGFANYYAQQELNDFLDFWRIAAAQFDRTILFKDVDMEDIKDQILRAVLDRYFDKDQMLKEEYIEDFKERYSDLL